MRRPRESIPIGLTALAADVAVLIASLPLEPRRALELEVPSAHRATLVGRLRARRPEVVAGGVGQEPAPADCDRRLGDPDD